MPARSVLFAVLVGKARADCTSTHGVQCSLPATDIDYKTGVWSHEQCCQLCQESTRGCKAWSWQFSEGHCHLHSSCQRIPNSKYHSGTLDPGPSPSPPGPSPGPSPGPAPGPAPAPTPDNPLGIQPLPKRSDNFFLLIGDYGHDGGPNGCTSKVADMMNDYVRNQQAQGKRVLFVGALGDNFYSRGLADDSKWQTIWSNVYGVNDPSKPLHNVPWMGVMGNHDLGGSDPGCACGKGCKQIQTAPKNFYMPGYYWNYYIPGAELEVVGLDTNNVDVNSLGGDGCHGHSREVCDKCGWGSQVRDYLNGVRSKGEELLVDRARASSAKTVLIMQHYNTGPGKQLKQKFEQNNGGRAKVLSAYGHRHEQKCEGDRTNGCDVILSGGGGGWRGGRGDYYYGFTAVHLKDDGGYQTVLETGDVRIRQTGCKWWGPGEATEAQRLHWAMRNESSHHWEQEASYTEEEVLV